MGTSQSTGTGADLALGIAAGISLTAACLSVMSGLPLSCSGAEALNSSPSAPAVRITVDLWRKG